MASVWPPAWALDIDSWCRYLGSGRWDEALAFRYRAADLTAREQIRWFVWAGSLGAIVAATVEALMTVDPDVLVGPGGIAIPALFSVAAALLPIACAIAILRYRLYAIDRIISRTFVYGAMLALVAGFYSASMSALQRLSVSLTGQTDLAIVLTTLVLAVSFEPLKRRLNAFTERFKASPGSFKTQSAAAALPEAALVDAVATSVIDRLRADATGNAIIGPAPRDPPA